MSGDGFDPRLLCEEDELERLESRNSLLLFDEVRRLAAAAWSGAPFALTGELLAQLHAVAVKDIYSDGGQWRERPIVISGSDHAPPPPDEIARWVADLVDTVNTVSARPAARPVELCAYLLWRVAWIHPFRDGNGRTSRALAYLLFLVRLGYEPGGARTFVDQIDGERWSYYGALEQADLACKAGRLDVSAMEALLTRLLKLQVVGLAEPARDEEAAAD